MAKWESMSKSNEEIQQKTDEATMIGRRTFSATLLILVITFFMSSFIVFAADNEITVTINGEECAMDTPARIINGRALVPLRVIFEALGATIEWNDGTQSVTAIKGDMTVTLQVGNREAFKNGEVVVLDVPAQIVENSTMIPVRFVSEAFGAEILYSDHAVHILTSDISEDQKTIQFNSQSDNVQVQATASPVPKTEVKPTSNEEKISVTSPISRNETATLTFRGKPNTAYSISVFYSTTASQAKGLEKKTTDSEGNVAWSWKIGGRTKSGTFKITVTGGGETYETHIVISA